MSKKLQLFNKAEQITITRIQQRLEGLREVASFQCETEEHRKARMALFFNINNYARAVKVAEDMLEKPSTQIRTYNQQKSALAKRCGGVDKQLPSGQSIIADISEPKKFKTELKELDKTYADEILKDHERQARNTELLNTEVEDIPTPHTVKPSWFPDSIAADKLAAISFMITTDDPDTEDESNKNKKEGKKPI